MCLDDLLVGLRHVLSIAVQQSFVVPYRHSLKRLAHRDRSDAVIDLYLHHLTPVRQVPPFHNTQLVSCHNRSLVRVQGCAVDRLIMLERFHRCPRPDIEEPQVSILASCVDEILLLPKTANRGYVPLEVAVIGSKVLVGPLQVVHLGAVVHPDDDLALVLGDLDAVRCGGELDGFRRVAGAVGRVPKLDGVVVGAAG